MTVNNDRKITISTGGSRTAKLWQPQTMMWSELVSRLSVFARGTETLQDYLKLPKSKQDSLKDVGGFVGGTLQNNRRKKGAVTGRDLLTLDLDNVPAGDTDSILKKLNSFNCSWCVYSTRKHEPARPRLRIVFPFDRTATADEYEPCARKMAALIGIGMMDHTTFEPERLMYWPTCCADSLVIKESCDGPFISVEGLLSTYGDWRNIEEWPVTGDETAEHKRLADKKGDPTQRTDLIGDWCRQYDIYAVMEQFLPHTYEPVDDRADRFTYTGGSTVGGAIVYDNGLFLYSHHATDPCSEQLVNSFDLLRLHKFGDLDKDADPGTPMPKMPSYAAMKKLAAGDKQVAKDRAKEAYASAQDDFGVAKQDHTDTVNDTDGEFMTHLAINGQGGIKKSIENVQVILEGDPKLSGRIRWDCFSEAVIGTAPMPWEPRRGEVGDFEWDEKFDDNGLMNYIEKLIECKDTKTIQAALLQVAARHQFNPIVDWLGSLIWDGTHRLDTMYVDYLGARSSEYVRQVSRKALVAGVSRIMQPGTKYDYMTVLTGGQGVGKTTFIKKIGSHWYNESIQTFEGKDALEAIHGAWIVNIDELNAFARSDIRLMKSFLTRTEDVYRAAYARKAEKHPRHCIFFGTSNDTTYLQDETGNRRFYPVDVAINEPTKRIFSDQKIDGPLLDDEVNQIWAEAVMYWRLGENLELSGEAVEEAKEQQAAHKDQDPWEAQIIDFIERPVLKSWNKMNISDRTSYWNLEYGKPIPAGQTVHPKTETRDRICAQEIWVECFSNKLSYMRRRDSRQINDILANIPGWDRVTNSYNFGPYGKVKGGFKRP
jgi:Predicted P-loop ATPase and inactivated derivatives